MVRRDGVTVTTAVAETDARGHWQIGAFPLHAGDNTLVAQAQNKKPLAGPKDARPIRVDVGKDKTGGESSKFLSMVGDWMVVEDGGKKVYAVDGRQWLRGNPARGLAEKARTIYGSKHEDFVDNVKAFAYFPISVAKDINDFQNGEISMKFKLISGQLDKCAGILFNVKPNPCNPFTGANGKADTDMLI